MNQSYIQRIILSGLFIGMAIVLPFFTGQIQALGQSILPMHLPILICGFICGPKYAAISGFIAPILRSILFGMPPMVPVALAMSFELATYGFVIGLLAMFLSLKRWINLYIIFLVAMVAGRIVLGLSNLWLYGLAGKSYGFEIFISMAIIDSLPGIILQMITVPIIIYSLSPWIERLNNDTR